MKQKWKGTRRFLSLLLAMVMLVGMLPTSAVADTATYTGSSKVEFIYTQRVVTSKGSNATIYSEVIYNLEISLPKVTYTVGETLENLTVNYSIVTNGWGQPGSGASIKFNWCSKLEGTIKDTRSGASTSSTVTGDHGKSEETVATGTLTGVTGVVEEDGTVAVDLECTVKTTTASTEIEALGGQIKDEWYPTSSEKKAQGSLKANVNPQYKVTTKDFDGPGTGTRTFYTTERQFTVSEAGDVVGYANTGITANLTPVSGTMTTSNPAAGTAIDLQGTNEIVYTWDKAYTVSFYGNAADAYNVPNAKTVASGSSLSNIAKPKRNGYTFLGWNTDSDAATAAISADGTISNITADTDYYAIWKEQINPYTITYDANGSANASFGTDGTASVNPGDAASFTVVVAKGYDVSQLNVTANGLGLSATSSKVGADGKTTLTYSFIPTKNTEVAINQAPEKLQYSVTLPISDTSRFDASFTTAGLSGKSATVAYGGTVSFKVESKSDKWTVGKVYANGMELTANNGVYTISNIEENQTIAVAMEEVQFYTLTYVVDGTTYLTQQVAGGTTIAADDLAAGQTKAGYNFCGWYSDPEDYKNSKVESVTVNEDTALYGFYAPVVAQIRFNINAPREGFTYTVNGKDIGIAGVMKPYGTAVQLPAGKPVDTEGEYVFKGWAMSEDGEPVYQPGDTFSTEILSNTTLFAIWEKQTYTVTLNAGAGYTIHHDQQPVVKHGETFTFRVVVDDTHAETKPYVTMTYVSDPENGTVESTTLTGTEVENDAYEGYTVYEYTTPAIKQNVVINVAAKVNKIYTVTFRYGGLDAGRTENPVNEDIYLTQKVEWNQTAAQPEAPVVEGYDFLGWYTKDEDGEADDGVSTTALLGTETIEGYTAYQFATPVTENVTIYAMFKAKTPIVEFAAVSGTGWSIQNVTYTDVDGFTMSVPNPSAENLDYYVYIIKYGTDVSFDLVVEEGYDYSDLAVAANGYALTPVGDAVTDADTKATTIPFKLTKVTEPETTIAVTGIVRKTVTLTYYANATDDVEHVPGQQVVNYYVDGAEDNTDLVDITPVRDGYAFCGWSTDPAAAAEPDDLHQPGDTSIFQQDTNLYAIWKATELRATLTVKDNYLTDNGISYAYENSTIRLVGQLNKVEDENVNVQGSFMFYRQPKTEGQDEPDATAWEYLGSDSIQAGFEGSFETTVPEYKTDSRDYWYGVKFVPTSSEGYAATEIVAVEVVSDSRAIAWTETEGAVNRDITIYEADGTTPMEGDHMIANTVYVLEIPEVQSLDDHRNLVKGNNGLSKLTVGQHYEIIWQYMDAENSWVDYPNGTVRDSNRIKIEAEYSQYQFRAVVKPLENSSCVYDKAAYYQMAGDAYTRVEDQYDNYLYTSETDAVAVKPTETTLTITAPTEGAKVMIGGVKTFGSEHFAQYEGKDITLTAKVTEQAGDKAAVPMGQVSFYYYAENSKTWELIDTVPVQTEGDTTGMVSITYTMDEYDTDKLVTKNKITFKAVYIENVTYETSSSLDTVENALQNVVFIKSAKFQTPIIDSQLEGKDGRTATTYTEDLTELLAGVTHTFTLRQNPAQDDGDKQYSVVALDGRNVEDGEYTITWIKSVGDNDEISDTDTVTFVTSDNKVGDSWLVRLTAKDGANMVGSADSKRVVIGKKQDVVVTVSAVDAIAKTDAVDVYQLNDITLRALVEAKEETNKKPTGTVAFYYVDGERFVYLSEAVLAEGTDGKMYAEIVTDQLPVEVATGTKRDVTVTAVYLGDKTFDVSRNWTKDGESETYGITKAEVEGYVVPTVVTVYSSVVYGCEHEHQPGEVSGCKGVHIAVTDGVLKANENHVTVSLDKVYTLDREAENAETIALLQAGTDYTIFWQKRALSNNDDYSDNSGWTTITGQTGTELTIDTVEQNMVYRAVITVANPATAIVKGSDAEVDQGTVGEVDSVDGRKVYYSNVLVSTDGQATISVALNTSELGENLEGITEGETVTANVFVSGAASATPNAAVTVTVTNDEASGNDEAYEITLTGKNTVNGWNQFNWDTTGVKPGFYTMTVNAKSNTGYEESEITRSILVRESTYDFTITNTETAYNGRTQGLEVTLKDFDFGGTGVNDAAARVWTVKYYDAKGNLVEPSDAGTYTAVVTLPASAYWTEKVVENVTFTIKQREVSVVDIIAQTKVYDNSTSANIVEVMLNDAVTDQENTGLPTGNTGVLNGDSIYATATGVLATKNAGKNTVTATNVTLGGDDAANYKVVGTYSEPITVLRSQVYGTSATLELKKGETFPADQVISMIDQSGRKISLGTGDEDYTLTFYYHGDTKIEKTESLDKLGLYTVVARPNQENYKSGVTMKFTVVEGETVIGTLAEPKASTLITITDTVDRFDAIDGVTTSVTNSAATVTVEYQNGSSWRTDKPTNAGRYLVKATASTGDVAYGIYTIVKVNPAISISAEDAVYNSMDYTGITTTDSTGTGYVTYSGDIAIGTNVAKDGNVDEQAPVNAGTYTATLHVNETTNYTAHEVTTSFVISRKPLTITADSWQTTQYGAFPDMTATYDGLAGEEDDTTPDTSLRDVQIAPEFLYNPTAGKSNYTNDSLDQVGRIVVQPVDALSRNYAITYVNGEYTKQDQNANPALSIHGLPQNAGDSVIAYYGDEIQLYPYGNYNTFANDSSLLEWSVEKGAGFVGSVTIGAKTGVLNVEGVGEFTVTLSRGKGDYALTTSVTVTAKQKEVQIALSDYHKVYNASSQTYAGSIAAFDLDWLAVNNPSLITKVQASLVNKERTNIGAQITEAPAAVLKLYQYRTYGGKLAIHDRDMTVTPVGDSAVYNDLRTAANPAYTESVAGVLSNVGTAAQTDGYNRLDTQGYEILVAGTEDMNYNVTYVTDTDKKSDTPKSVVTTKTDVTFTSRTTAYLNDATVYGDAYNALDWKLANVASTTRSGESYADNLADFDLENIFIWQDKDDCIGNAVTYKAANRTYENQAVLAADRTATNPLEHANYILKFQPVANANGTRNYQLTNDKEGNKETTTDAVKAGSLGFYEGSTELESGENFIEGSANISQRPVSLSVTAEKPVFYWHMPQNQMLEALMGIMAAEGLAKGHTVKDLDLSFTLIVNNTRYPIDGSSSEALDIPMAGMAKIAVKIGDTNYYLLNDDGEFEFDVELKTIQIEATYTTKTFNGFTVLIKYYEDGKEVAPLTSADGLTYKIFKKTGDTVDTTVAYAAGTLTYTGRTQSDGKDLCGVFTASYKTLPTLGSNETYYIQMYEYGVPLVTSK